PEVVTVVTCVAILASLLVLALSFWSSSQLAIQSRSQDHDNVDVDGADGRDGHHCPLGLAHDSDNSPNAHRLLHHHRGGPDVFLDPKTVSIRDPTALSPVYLIPTDAAVVAGHGTPNLARGECLYSVLTKKVPALIKRLNEDPEAKALRPLNVPSYLPKGGLGSSSAGTSVTMGEGAMIHFNGLDMSVFRGKHVAIMGDSTMYYMTKWIDQLMMAQWPYGKGEDPPLWTDLGLNEAASIIYERSSRLDLGLPYSPNPMPRSSMTTARG
ncbi:hypothetical protein ACHAWF_013533, partial [Thalassiosira exigua]